MRAVPLAPLTGIGRVPRSRLVHPNGTEVAVSPVAAGGPGVCRLTERALCDPLDGGTVSMLQR